MKIAILGCGYVGLKLGTQLSDAGHEVVGVRRSEDGVAEIAAAGFDAARADITNPASLAEVPDADAVVFAASSGGRGVEAARDTYLGGLEAVIDEFGGRSNPPERLIYTSSTGVYGDHDGAWVDEETPLHPETERERVLVEAERLAREQSSAVGIDGTVVRFGGLYGPNRYRLERYLTGPVTAGYLNMIHRDDAAGAVRHMLDEDVARDEVVLAVDDEPVDKWTFADWLADQCEVDRPPKRTAMERLGDESLSESARRRIMSIKQCDNEKLRSMGYEFKYPTYREGYRLPISSYVNPR